jgi:hypothetical protein
MTWFTFIALLKNDVIDVSGWLCVWMDMIPHFLSYEAKFDCESFFGRSEKLTELPGIVFDKKEVRAVQVSF